MFSFINTVEVNEGSPLIFRPSIYSLGQRYSVDGILKYCNISNFALRHYILLISN